MIILSAKHTLSQCSGSGYVEGEDSQRGHCDQKVMSQKDIELK